MQKCLRAKVTLRAILYARANLTATQAEHLRMHTPPSTQVVYQNNKKRY